MRSAPSGAPQQDVEPATACPSAGAIDISPAPSGPQRMRDSATPGHHNGARWRRLTAGGGEVEEFEGLFLRSGPDGSAAGRSGLRAAPAGRTGRKPRWPRVVTGLGQPGVDGAEQSGEFEGAQRVAECGVEHAHAGDFGGAGVIHDVRVLRVPPRPQRQTAVVAVVAQLGGQHVMQLNRVVLEAQP